MAINPFQSTTPSTNQSGPLYVDSLTSRYLIKPKSVSGIGGFLFDYEGEDTTELHADITDHYAENNTAIQDHVARNPTHLTLRGFVAELVYKPNAGILGAINSIQNRLTTVPAYLGKYTPGAVANIQKVATQASNVGNQINQAIARVKNVVGFFGNSAPGQTKQQAAFNKLSALWETNQMMIVETPFGIFGNMLIEDLLFVQGDETKYWSDVTVKLKAMRFASTETASIDFKSGRAAPQAESQINKGSTKGTPVNQSVLRGLLPKAFN